MKIDTLNFNVSDILKHLKNENSKEEIKEVGEFRFISINESDILLNFDEQCDVNDTTGMDLIPKIENYLVPSMDLSADSFDYGISLL